MQKMRAEFDQKFDRHGYLHKKKKNVTKHSTLHITRITRGHPSSTSPFL